jgi:hypothetical protein
MCGIVQCNAEMGPAAVLPVRNNQLLPAPEPKPLNQWRSTLTRLHVVGIGTCFMISPLVVPWAFHNMVTGAFLLTSRFFVFTRTVQTKRQITTEE